MQIIVKMSSHTRGGEVKRQKISKSTGLEKETQKMFLWVRRASTISTLRQRRVKNTLNIFGRSLNARVLR